MIITISFCYSEKGCEDLFFIKMVCQSENGVMGKLCSDPPFCVCVCIKVENMQSKQQMKLIKTKIVFQPMSTNLSKFTSEVVALLRQSY